MKVGVLFNGEKCVNLHLVASSKDILKLFQPCPPSSPRWPLSSSVCPLVLYLDLFNTHLYSFQFRSSFNDKIISIRKTSGALEGA